MGAQAAELLARGGPIGDVPDEWRPVDGLRLEAPQPYELRRVALSHSGVGLSPTGFDGRSLHLRLRGPGGRPTRVVVHPSLEVEADAPLDPATVRDLRVVLDLDTDLSELWSITDSDPRWHWARASGAGRLLRSPTVWQDAVGVLASTNTSYAATRAMVGALVGAGAFPAPDEVLALGEPELRGRGWGYRAPHLLALAERGDESWRDLARRDGEVAREVAALPGFGPFATAQLMPLLGRPRPLVADRWLRGLVDLDDYRPLGPWAGSVLWLDVTARWLGRT